MKNIGNPYFSGSLAIAVSIVLLGWFLYGSITHFKDSERVVSVKGLSEREVRADRVIWPLVYKQAGNDLLSIYNDLEQANQKIIRFLTSNGITDKEITLSPPAVMDSEAERYAGEVSRYRYKTISVVTVATDKVDLVRQLMAKQGDLMKQGVAISGGDYEYPILFSFNGLNTIKPEIIVEATQNARASAEKFAKDSDSKLGKIKTAYQGQISITDRDNNTPYIKIVRLVTTIEYYLKD